MNRKHIVAYVLQRIYDLTGFDFEEDSVLDFDSMYDVQDFLYALSDDFCLPEFLTQPYTVSELIDEICKGIGTLPWESQVTEDIDQAMIAFATDLSELLGVTITAQELREFVDVEELMLWVCEVLGDEA